MSAEGVKKFIASVDLIFPAPQYDGDKTRQGAWIALLTSTIGGCTDEVLAEAAGVILRHRNPKKDGRFFPTPQECSEACSTAARDIERRRTPLLGKMKQEMPYESKVNLARDLMRTSLGKQAIKDGWGQSMFHFCVNNQRGPSAAEVDECKRSAKSFAVAHAECLKRDGPLEGAWARYAESMVRKARELMGVEAKQ